MIFIIRVFILARFYYKCIIEYGIHEDDIIGRGGRSIATLIPFGFKPSKPPAVTEDIPHAKAIKPVYGAAIRPATAARDEVKTNCVGLMVT